MIFILQNSDREVERPSYPISQPPTNPCQEPAARQQLQRRKTPAVSGARSGWGALSPAVGQYLEKENTCYLRPQVGGGLSPAAGEEGPGQAR